MKENKQISITNQIFWGRIAAGVSCIILSATRMFSGICSWIINILLLIVFAAALVFLKRVNLEEADEMAYYNDMKAKADTREIMHSVYCALAIVSTLVFGLLQNADIFWADVISAIFFLIMGIEDLVTGIIFRRLEAE